MQYANRDLTHYYAVTFRIIMPYFTFRIQEIFRWNLSIRFLRTSTIYTNEIFASIERGFILVNGYTCIIFRASKIILNGGKTFTKMNPAYWACTFFFHLSAKQIYQQSYLFFALISCHPTTEIVCVAFVLSVELIKEKIIL